MNLKEVAKSTYNRMLAMEYLVSVHDEEKYEEYKEVIDYAISKIDSPDAFYYGNKNRNIEINGGACIVHIIPIDENAAEVRIFVNVYGYMKQVANIQF